MLIVVHYRNIQLFLQALFDVETIGRLDILKVDAPKSWSNRFYGVNEFIRICCIQFKIKHINIREDFKQYALSFHHWLRRLRAYISKTQHRRTV